MRTYFEKPAAVCTQAYNISPLKDTEDARELLYREKRRIENLVSDLGYSLRLAQNSDVWNINELTYKNFTPEAAQGISLYDLYRFINYGYPVIILNSDNEVLGYDLSISYNDEHKTSYEIAIAIDNTIAGNRLGALVSTYGAILGWERGSEVRKSSVHPLNTASVKNLLNYTGFYVADFISNFLEKLGPRLVLAMNLTPQGILNQGISIDAVKLFVEKNVQDIDYKLVECDDYTETDRVYRETQFRIIAYIPADVFGKRPLFLATPKL